MDFMPRIALGPGDGLGPSSGRTGAARALAWLGGILATFAALALGALLALFAAAAVTVIALFASVLVFLTGLAVRARQRVYARPAAILEARKVGHAWVAYSWDRPSR